MSVGTKNTSSEWWKSANRKPSDSQIPTAPAAATFLRPEKTNPSESVTYLPGLLCYLCPSPLTNLLFFTLLQRGTPFMFEDLKGRTAVVFGVANKRSIAWAIAQGLHAAGANLAITYQNERMEMEAKDLILSLPGAEAFMCDVSKDEEITQLFEKLKARYGKLHALVHSVAFAPAEELKGDFVNTTREGFRVAHDVSVYSLIAVSRAAAPLMEDGGSIITMTYYGAEKGCAALQRHGRGQGGARMHGPVSGAGSGTAEDPRQCDLGGADQDAGRARHLRPRRHAAFARRTRAAATQC